MTQSNESTEFKDCAFCGSRDLDQTQSPMVDGIRRWECRACGGFRVDPYGIEQHRY